MDADSNSVLQEFTATGLDQVVSVGEALPEILAERDAEKQGKSKPSQPVIASHPHPPGQSRPFAGFDGLGGSDQQYASAQVPSSPNQAVHMSSLCTANWQQSSYQNCSRSPSERQRDEFIQLCSWKPPLLQRLLLTG